jgi:hypothetical protein
MNVEANKLSPKPHITLLDAPWEIGFRALCHSRIPKDELPSQDAQILTRFADHVANIDEECSRTGRVTDEAVKLIDAHRFEDRPMLYLGLFGREPIS